MKNDIILFSVENNEIFLCLNYSGILQILKNGSLLAEEGYKLLYLKNSDFSNKEICDFLKLLDEKLKEIFLFKFDITREFSSEISQNIHFLKFKNRTFMFSALVFPKELEIIPHNQNKYFYLKLSNYLFSLYSETTKTLKIKNKNSFNKNNLEENYYLTQTINKLNEILNEIINFKNFYKDKIIVSDKIIGNEIEYLNNMEQNPLKIYQKIPEKNNKEIAFYINTILYFFEKNRLPLFNSYEKQYAEIKNKLNLIKNKLNFIIKSNNKIIIDETNKEIFIKKALNNYQIHKNILFFKKFVELVMPKNDHLEDYSDSYTNKINMAEVWENINNKRFEKINSNYDFYIKMKNKHDKLNNDFYKNNELNLTFEPDKAVINKNESFYIFDDKYKIDKKDISTDFTKLFRDVVGVSGILQENKDESYKKGNGILIYSKKSILDLSKRNHILKIDNLNQAITIRENNIELTTIENYQNIDNIEEILNKSQIFHSDNLEFKKYNFYTLNLDFLTIESQ